MKLVTRTLPNPAQSNAQPLFQGNRQTAPQRQIVQRSQPGAAAQQAARNGGYQLRGKAPQPKTVERLTVATSPATIYGCTGIFDLCGDADLMSLSFAGMEPLLDWIGWEATDVCEIKKNFITWQRPAYSGGNPTAGYVADPCGDANGVDWGACDFVLTDFARLRRKTPTRDLTRVGLRLCEQQPRYRLDGTPINDDDEYDMRIVTEVQMGDLKRMLVTGNNSTPGQFDGLEALVNNDHHGSNGQRCAIMDSNVIDWNARDLDGGSGIEWNGVAQPTDKGFIDFLIASVRLTLQRIRWSESLASQGLEIGDIAFVAPTRLIQCVLDAYTCWRVCPGGQYNETNIGSLEARRFRDELNGGLYGAGKIFVDGYEIPMIPYDWELIKGPTLNDAYLLTRKVGGIRTINGQYNDMRVAQQKLPGLYDVTDGGRLLTWVDTDATCYERFVEFQPRLLMWAPFLQTRFQDVQCSQIGPNIGPDPTVDSYYPEDSFISAGS